MKYRYFISYQYVTGRGWGFGHCEHIRDTLIRNGDDVAKIAESLKPDIPGVKSVTIVTFQLFDK